MPASPTSTSVDAPTARTFIHIWRVDNGPIVEHWACLDDMGLREQLTN